MRSVQGLKASQKHHVLFFLALFIPAVLFGYDLSKVKVEKLENGLTVMILEDHFQPLVSTQMLYKVGGRNECVGTTGLAHFVEHMAFRSTKNFPDTQEAIYKVGGEWHGYTWIDQTTYFETVPVQHLDQVLLLQADRMVNVLNRKEEVEAERGAVLTELHSYENDPGTVLFDRVLAISFLEHPYRYNTIGWTSDVEKITHKDLVDFYQRFYQPSNAVLAIAGDVETDEVMAKVRRAFGSFSSSNVESQPRTVEPSQQGERRITLQGSGPFHYYQISYRAPSARDQDFASFLLLQSILGGGSGVNFRQSGFSEPVKAGTRLAGIGSRINTFFTPTSDPYVFNITGRAIVNPDAIEKEIEQKIEAIRTSGVAETELDSAKKQILAELIFDIETTEDAAHQMAYFEGIGAFSVLQKLSQLIQSVSLENVRSTAQKYLQPTQRSIGWYLGTPEKKSSRVTGQRQRLAAWKTSATSVRTPHLAGPEVSKLQNGTPVIVQKLPRTRAGYLRILLPTNTVESSGSYSTDDPVWRYTSVHVRFLREDLATTISDAKSAIESDWKPVTTDPASLEDPEFRLGKALEESLGAVPNQGPAVPALIVVAGDVDPAKVKDLLKKSFGKIRQPKSITKSPLQVRERTKTIRIPGKAQSQVGYAVPAPLPSDPQSFEYRLLLYIMSHGYGGRLGKELINRRGLIYYISSDYQSDGTAAWISLRFGVNPDKLEETKREFVRLLEELRRNPPTETELAEAKEHLIGRRISAHQSNEELTAFYAKEWIEQGRLLSQSEFEKQIRSTTLPQIHRIIPSFLDGATVTVDTR